MYLFLLRMPGLKAHRNLVASSLGSLDCKPEIIQNIVRIADKAASLPEDVEQEREPAQKRSRPAPSHDEDLGEPDSKARKLTHEATAQPTVTTQPIAAPVQPPVPAVPVPIQGLHNTYRVSQIL